jgi:carbonic anhydrase
MINKENMIFKDMLAGNDRFAQGETSVNLADQILFESLSKGQHPKAAIISCSDSRVIPEYIFDQGIGALFVIRIAGNVFTATVIESLTLAVKDLGVNTVVVMSHTNCGAVKSALNGGNSLITDEISRSGEFEKHHAEELTIQNARNVALEIDERFDVDVFALNYELSTRKVNIIEVQS